MKKITAILVSVLAFMLLFNSCGFKDFGDINKDPNKPSTPFTTYFFTQACWYVPQFTLRNVDNGYDPWQQEWPGYLSEAKNNQYGPLNTTSYFNSQNFYLYPLKNLQMIIDLNEDEETKGQSNVAVFGTSANQIAAAKTLMAYFYMSITDIQGPIILSEALKGESEGIWKPKYDSQEEAYTLLNNSLEEAYAQFDETGTLSSTADILYGGDIAKWKKFNASLRMLMAIKLADVAPDTGKTRFAKAYADGGMESVADGLDYTYDDLNWNYLYYWCSPDYSAAGFTQVPNMLIVEQMKALEDNRMFEYFEIEGYWGARDEATFPRDQYTSFYGVPFGLSSNEAVSSWTDCCCSINSKVLGMTATIPIIPAARVLLTEAEAAYRGWISDDAKDLYEAGIKASFAWWGAKDVDAYIAKPAVAYDAANGLEQIAIQRWIASYLSDGVEAWSDWRRLDIPKMYVGPGAIDKHVDHYPYRLPFDPGNDAVNNAENYAAAIAGLSDGKDTKDSRVWWDVADNEKGVLTDAQCTPSISKPADWQAKMTGTMKYGLDTWGGAPVYTDHAATWYEDVNHPGTFKIDPFGDAVLVFKANGDEYVVDNQIVGEVSGEAVNVADWNIDQNIPSGNPSEEGVCYYDTDEAAYLFLLVYRSGGPRGGGSTGFLCYGYDAFVPDSD
ncbi:MAG: SusD/RagB family nutrient-binding outer membrane lipoprotein [Bacteroidales bacterium]|nr:SusD/RagB family nutrient-binding outer membrane lipoprotein [Bacteroidales bacterium]